MWAYAWRVAFTILGVVNMITGILGQGSWAKAPRAGMRSQGTAELFCDIDHDGFASIGAQAAAAGGGADGVGGCGLVQHYNGGTIPACTAVNTPYCASDLVAKCGAGLIITQITNAKSAQGSHQRDPRCRCRDLLARCGRTEGWQLRKNWTARWH